MFRDVASYLTLPRDHCWIVPDVLAPGGALNIFGKPKQGKSYAALQLASAIGSGGAQWLGLPILQHGPVMYLQVDTPRIVWAERLELMTAKGFGFQNVWISDPTLIFEEGGGLPFDILGAQQQRLREQVLGIKPIVVMVDTIREVHGGDENTSDHMRNVLASLKAACFPAALVIVSHSRKDKVDGAADLMDDNRGSGYLAGAVDCVMRVRKQLIEFESRTTGHTTYAITHDDVGMIELADHFHTKAVELVRLMPGQPVAAMTKALHEAFPRRTAEACRSEIRRAAKKYAAPVAPPAPQPTPPSAMTVGVAGG